MYLNLMLRQREYDTGGWFVLSDVSYWELYENNRMLENVNKRYLSVSRD